MQSRDSTPVRIIDPLGRPRPEEEVIRQKPALKWDWPLGEVKVLSTPTEFHVELEYTPFKPGEVMAKVMHEGPHPSLVIACISNVDKPAHEDVLRTYHLPENTIPETWQFRLKSNDILSVTAKVRAGSPAA